MKLLVVILFWGVCAFATEWIDGPQGGYYSIVEYRGKTLAFGMGQRFEFESQSREWQRTSFVDKVLLFDICNVNDTLWNQQGNDFDEIHFSVDGGIHWQKKTTGLQVFPTVMPCFSGPHQEFIYTGSNWRIFNEQDTLVFVNDSMYEDWFSQSPLLDSLKKYTSMVLDNHWNGETFVGLAGTKYFLVWNWEGTFRRSFLNDFSLKGVKCILDTCLGATGDSTLVFSNDLGETWKEITGVSKKAIGVENLDGVLVFQDPQSALWAVDSNKNIVNYSTGLTAHLAQGSFWNGEDFLLNSAFGGVLEYDVVNTSWQEKGFSDPLTARIVKESSWLEIDKKWTLLHPNSGLYEFGQDTLRLKKSIPLEQSVNANFYFTTLKESGEILYLADSFFVDQRSDSFFVKPVTIPTDLPKKTEASYLCGVHNEYNYPNPQKVSLWCGSDLFDLEEKMEFTNLEPYFPRVANTGFGSFYTNHLGELFKVDELTNEKIESEEIVVDVQATTQYLFVLVQENVDSTLAMRLKVFDVEGSIREYEFLSPKMIEVNEVDGKIFVTGISGASLFLDPAIDLVRQDSIVKTQKQLSGFDWKDVAENSLVEVYDLDGRLVEKGIKKDLEIKNTKPFVFKVVGE